MDEEKKELQKVKAHVMARLLAPSAGVLVGKNLSEIHQAVKASEQIADEIMLLCKLKDENHEFVSLEARLSKIEERQGLKKTSGT